MPMLVLFFKMTTVVVVPWLLTLALSIRLPLLQMTHGCSLSLPWMPLILCVPFFYWDYFCGYPFYLGYLLCRGYRVTEATCAAMGTHVTIACISTLVTQVTSASGFMRQQKCFALRTFPVWFIFSLWRSFCLSDCYLANQHDGFMVVLILTGSEFKFQPNWLRFML